MDISELPSPTDVVQKITALLSERKFHDVLTTIGDNKYSGCVKGNSWDLILEWIKHLDKETNRTDPELFDCCEQLIQVVAEKSNPGEVLLEFIEQAELAKDHIKFFAILRALQTVLKRVILKRRFSLEWTLNTIQQHVQTLSMPGSYFEGDEKLLLDSDDGVQEIGQFYSELLPFYKPFIQEVALPTNEALEGKAQRDLLAYYLLRLLEKPLACLDLEMESTLKNQGRRCAERIMEYLGQLVGNCFKFLEYAAGWQCSKKTDTDDVKDIFVNCPTLSLGVFYYLILSENVKPGLAAIPQVYDPLYMFQSLLHLVVDLLGHSEQFISRKGLLLAHAIICSDLIKVIPHEVLDSPVHCKFCINLTNIMIYSDIKPYRELGLKIFKTYIFKFDLKGRYLLILNLMNIIKHVNTRGFLISQYKDMLREAFAADENKIPEYFCGLYLNCMLNRFCHLAEGPETDIMDQGDQIITSLNLLIFLAIRDKYNATGVWNHFKSLDQTFLKPLKEGLIMSKTQYELKIKEIKNEQCGQGDMDFSLKVRGNQIPGLTKPDEIKLLESVMNNFATLEMLLARVEELIEIGPAA